MRKSISPAQIADGCRTTPLSRWAILGSVLCEVALWVVALVYCAYRSIFMKNNPNQLPELVWPGQGREALHAAVYAKGERFWCPDTRQEWSKSSDAPTGQLGAKE